MPKDFWDFLWGSTTSWTLWKQKHRLFLYFLYSPCSSCSMYVGRWLIGCLFYSIMFWLEFQKDTFFTVFTFYFYCKIFSKFNWLLGLTSYWKGTFILLLDCAPKLQLLLLFWKPTLFRLSSRYQFSHDVVVWAHVFRLFSLFFFTIKELLWKELLLWWKDPELFNVLFKVFFKRLWPIKPSPNFLYFLPWWEDLECTLVREFDCLTLGDVALYKCLFESDNNKL